MSQDGRGARRLSPTQPIIQFGAPGVFWTMKLFARQFHRTPQPIDQPWPEPIEPRLRRSIEPPGARQLSKRIPVDHRACASAAPSPVKVQLSTTIGPETPEPVATNQTLSAVTEQRSIST